MILSTVLMMFTGLVRDTTLTDTTKTLNGLNNLTPYYWRVRAKNEIGWGSFNTWFKLTTIIAVPALSAHLNPADGSVGNLTTLTLRWRSAARASVYRLQIATDTGFTSLVVDDSTLTDTSRSVSGLQPLTTYYWRVNAANVGGTSGFTVRWSFRTLGVPVPAVLLNPPNSATNQPTTLTFRWRRGVDQTLTSFNETPGDAPVTILKYWYESVTDTLTMANVNRDSTLIDTLKTVTGLLNTTPYFWRVATKNEIGWGAFSPWWRFTTSTTYVEEGGGIPGEFSLHQNYPNPFNPSTTIKYDIPSDAHVLLKVYSCLGQEVATLVDDVMEAGGYRLQWNTAGLASGVYLYRLRAGDFIQARKLMLIR